MMSLGSPNGTRIITCVTQTLLNHLAYKLPLYEAVNSMRYHHQWYPDEIRVESPGFSDAVTKDLQARGHTVSQRDYGCRVQAVGIKQGLLQAVSDIRGEGFALAN